MVKFLATLMVFSVAVFLLGGFFAVPASAQSEGIKESCTLSGNLDIEIPFKSNLYTSIVSIKEGSTISPQIKSGGIANKGVDAKFKLLTQTVNAYAVVNDVDAITAIENKWGLICLVNTINSATRWIFFVLISVSFVMILLAGFFWITSGTSSENQKKAGQMIAAALVGIAIALMSRVIPGIVIGILT